MPLLYLYTVATHVPALQRLCVAPLNVMVWTQAYSSEGCVVVEGFPFVKLGSPVDS